ncbi:MAG: transposase [Clostridia bacterium]|nr:transposase [Clostridia bacterium]
MSFRVYQVNKKTGVTYVYEAVSFWDKDKKQSRNKQVCVGKIDPLTGEFIPSKRLNPDQAAARDPAVTATARIVGPTFILDSITGELGLNKLLKACFPKIYEQILSMAYYLTARGGALSHCESWSKSHVHPFNNTLTSQRMTDILRSINTDGQQSFFAQWGQQLLENDYLCYDITSVSSYGTMNEYVKYGYNRDGEKLAQINLALLFAQKSQLPVYYNRLPGNISDVSTLHHFLETFGYLKMGKLHLIMDRGFYSQKNVNELLAARDKFTIAVPSRLKWVQGIIDARRDTIQNPEGYRNLDGEVLYVHSQLYPWGKERRRCYLHLYYNAHAAADAVDGFTEELLSYKQELESGQLVKEHEDAYQTFFTVKETPVRGKKVLFNNQAIQKYRNQYAGFYTILSNDIKDPVEALRVYRNKDSVEKAFDDLKNQLDMKRLRIHNSVAMDGRIFVQFISLIYMSALRKKMQDADLTKKYTVRELLEEMETLTQIRYSGKYGHILTEITKPQRTIIQNLNLKLPS